MREPLAPATRNLIGSMIERAAECWAAGDEHLAAKAGRRQILQALVGEDRRATDPLAAIRVPRAAPKTSMMRRRRRRGVGSRRAPVPTLRTPGLSHFLPACCLSLR